MQIHQVQRISDNCSFALLVVRFDRPLDGAEQEAVRASLAAAAVIVDPKAESGDDEEGDDEEADDEDGDDGDAGEAADPADAPASCFVLGNFVPRTAAALEQAEVALDGVRTAFGATQAWVWPVNTEIDAFADAEDDDSESDEDDDSDGDSDDDDSDDDDGPGAWRFGPPPLATTAPFVVERFPEIADEFDGDDFGIALKLAGPAVPGEAAVLDAIHHVWLMHYIDGRAEERPFRNAAMTFDAANRSALLWVDRFTPPTPPRVMAEHVMAIVSALHGIVPIARARFAEATMRIKYAGISGDTTPPFILAGNPLREAFSAAADPDAGEHTAVAWAESQREWSPQEVAAMYVELGQGCDPDEAESASAGVRMFDRAAALDPENDDAATYPLIALVRSGQVDAALARAKTISRLHLRVMTVDLVADHAFDRLADALPLLDRESVVATSNEMVAGLVATIGSRLPAELPRVLELLPDEEDMVSHLHAAAFKIEDQRLRLAVLEKVISFTEPSEPGSHRTNYLSAHNNACIIAHALGDYPRARALADGALPFADENPYIYHSAACAYAAVGDFEKALAQVERAVAHDYDHLDRVEVDTDLGELLQWPQFQALFEARRVRRAKSEPVIEATSESFATDVLACDRPVLVDFTATWCGPCKRQGPIVEKLAAASEGRYRVVKVDIDESEDLAQRYDATSVPTLVVFVGGQEKARTVGLSDAAELRRLIDGAG